MRDADEGNWTHCLEGRTPDALGMIQPSPLAKSTLQGCPQDPYHELIKTHHLEGAR